MGHSRADIFEKYYTAQVVGADTQSAYLGTPSRSALVALAGRMSLTRDPRAQSRIKVKVEEAMKAYVDPDPDNRSRDVASMRAELIQNHGLLQNAGTTPLHTAYRAECAKRHQRRIAYKRAVEAKAREEYFVTLGDREIEEQLLGPVDEDPIAGPHFYSKERRTLAALMCSVVDVDVLSHEERVSRRFEAFHNMRALCAMVEPRPNVSRSLKRSASPSGPDESEDDGPFDAIFTSLHCPWCFYNERATKEARDTTFSKQNNLLRHIDNHHLSRRTYGADTLCPYPDCAFAPSSEAVLKNHLAKEHGRRLRKKRALATPSPSGKAHITCLPIQSFRKK